jgi:hypothetical protein
VFDRFTERARKVMTLARQEAQALQSDFQGTEHLLLGLLMEGHGVAALILTNLGVDLPRVRAEVARLVGPAITGQYGSLLPFTPRAKRVLECALEEAVSLGHEYIGTEHLLLGLVREEEGPAATVLRNLGVMPEAVREQVVELLGEPDPPSGPPVEEGTSPTDSPAETGPAQPTAAFHRVAGIESLSGSELKLIVRLRGVGAGFAVVHDRTVIANGVRRWLLDYEERAPAPGPTANRVAVAIYADHPLAWDHAHPTLALELRSRPKGTEPLLLREVCRALHEGRLEATDPGVPAAMLHSWLPFDRYACPEEEWQRIFEAGRGRLAVGPRPLVAAYARALGAAGVRGKVLRVPGPAPVRCEVLVAPQGFVVAASFDTMPWRGEPTTPAPPPPPDPVTPEREDGSLHPVAGAWAGPGAGSIRIDAPPGKPPRGKGGGGGTRGGKGKRKGKGTARRRPAAGSPGPAFTCAAERPAIACLEGAWRAAQRWGHAVVAPVHLAAALLETECSEGDLLRAAGLDETRLRDAAALPSTGAGVGGAWTVYAQTLGSWNTAAAGILLAAARAAGTRPLDTAHLAWALAHAPDRGWARVLLACRVDPSRLQALFPGCGV